MQIRLHNTFPELAVLNLIKVVLNAARKDLVDNAANLEASLIYSIFEDFAVGKRNLFNEAKSILEREEGNEGYLDASLFLNIAKNSLPHIHVTVPGVSPTMPSIGHQHQNNDFLIKEGKGYPVYTKTFNATYDIVITSDSELEVVIINYILLATISSLLDHVDLAGFQNPKLSARDLQLYTENIPEPIFFKAINLSFFFELKAPVLNKNFLAAAINDIKSTGKPLIE